MEKIRILHTNDLHSHLKNWPKIRRFLHERQKIEKQLTVLTVDLGDFCDRWHPLTEATDGKANIELMNQANYDAVTIGNNEGIGNSKEMLNHLYDKANFTVVLDNLFDKSTLKRPSWSEEFKIFTTDQGTKVGMIAATAPFSLTYTPNGWDVRQWSDILPEIAHQLRSQVDVLVLLSHLGIDSDRIIAQEIPEIDVIIGSHTHHLLPKGEKINETLLAAAGRFGEYVGEVTLSIDQSHHMIKSQATTFATADMLSHPEDTEEIFSYQDQGEKILQAKKVAWLPYDLTLTGDNCLMTETLAAVKDRGQTDVAILNTGLFLGDLKKGVVNQAQLHQILPHPMHLIKVSLKGKDMERMILEMEKNRFFLQNFRVRGMGFRGKIFGELVYSGITYDAVNHQILWLNQPLEAKKEYQFTTVDHYMFIPFFPTIEIVGKVEFLFPEFIRMVLGDYLQKRYPISTQNKVR